MRLERMGCSIWQMSIPILAVIVWKGKVQIKEIVMELLAPEWGFGNRMMTLQ